MPKNPLSALMMAGVALVLVIYMFLFTIQENEVAVLSTFGKPTREAVKPGVSFKWPWPIQKVQRYDARLRVFKAPLEQMQTADKRALLVGSFLLWRIDSPQRFLERVREVEVAEAQLEDILRNHQAAAIAGARFGELVSTDPSQLRYAELEARIQEGVAREAKDFGVAVERVGIRRLALPEEITEAVFLRMRKDREALASEIRERGKRAAEGIRTQALEEQSKRLTEARAQARGLLAKAEEKARPHYARMAEEPELAIFLKKLEALEELLGDPTTTLILDSTQPPFDLLRASIAPVRSAH